MFFGSVSLQIYKELLLSFNSQIANQCSPQDFPQTVSNTYFLFINYLISHIRMEKCSIVLGHYIDLVNRELCNSMTEL